jgi:hypothetical protein
MTAAEFQACLPLVQHLAQDRVDAARAVLVDDEEQSEVAKRMGWSRQAVNICVNKVWAVLQNYKQARANEEAALTADLPKGWAMATVVAPIRMLEKFRDQVEDAISEQEALRAPARRQHE